MGIENVPCPRCGAHKLADREMTVEHGNPCTPASDTDITVYYDCTACGARYLSDYYLSESWDAESLCVDTSPLGGDDDAPAREIAESTASTPAPAPRARVSRRREIETIRYDYSETHDAINRLRQALGGRIMRAKQDPDALPGVIRDLNYVYEFYGRDDSFSRDITFVVTPTGSEKRFIAWLDENDLAEGILCAFL